MQHMPARKRRRRAKSAKLKWARGQPLQRRGVVGREVLATVGDDDLAQPVVREEVHAQALALFGPLSLHMSG